MSDIVLQQETTSVHPMPRQAITPMDMIHVAIQQNADIDKLEKLMALQERWEANEARKAFVTALSGFKRNPPEIFKNKLVSFATSKGKTEYNHATLDQVAASVSAAMSPHGLSFRWQTEQEGGLIRVTCIIMHSQGHSESVTLHAAPDESGGKNSIQAIGSAVTYLQRYTLLAATGLATREQDDDGVATTRKKLPEGDFEQFATAIKATATKEAAKAEWQKAVKACQAVGDVESANALKQVMLDHAAFIDSVAENEAKGG
jgi:hypothetical protein